MVASHTLLSDVGDEAPSSAAKGATKRLLARFPGSVALLLALCPVLLFVRVRGGDFCL
jgi:hypothetical protein